MKFFNVFFLFLMLSIKISAGCPEWNIHVISVILPYHHAINGIFDGSYESDKHLMNGTDLRTLPAIDPRAVVINEILVDPDPVIGLPNAEFIELFNASDNILNLENWSVSDAVSTGRLPFFQLLPSRFVILCKQGNQELFETYGDVISPDKWPSLNNAGDELMLMSADNILVDKISYKPTWFRDSEKQKGGWSIEQINPEHKCTEETNWNASINPSGGTPGTQNSLFNIDPDLRGPQIQKVTVVDANNIALLFNEKILPSSLHKTNFIITPTLNIKVLHYDLEEHLLTIATIEAMKSQEFYQLTIKNLVDCSGNIISPNLKPLDIILADPPDSGEVILNEILFNPRPGGKDFIEIYNRSDRHLNLKGWQIINHQKTQHTKPATGLDEEIIMAPGAYAVFTESAATILADYPTTPEANIHEVSQMPTLPDKEGNLTIISKDSSLMDVFDYNENLHHGLLKSLEGVSLEKISPSQPSNNPGNWHSAASNIGFATPGKRNSVWISFTPPSDMLTIEPKVFHPNNNGANDFTTLNYQFDKPGYSASISIYNISGNLVKVLANHEVLGTSGFYSWDGTNNNKKLVPTGYYIVLIVLFDLQGHAKKIKKTVTVIN